MAISAKDIVWLAGLLEGEGSFMSPSSCPKVSVGMTDEDVVRHAAIIMRCPVYTYGKEKPHLKQKWTAVCTGATAAGVMMSIFGLMGDRRRKRIKEVIDTWKNHKTNRHPRGFRAITKCHPGEIHHGHGLCRSCYWKEYKKTYVRKGREATC